MPSTPRRVRAPAFVLGLAAALLGAGAGPARADAPSPRPASAALGVHAMVYLDAPRSFKAAMFAASATLGASLVRVDLPLGLIFRAPGAPPDFSAFDDDVAVAREHGVRLVGILASTPAWAAGCPAGAAAELAPTCPYADLALYRRHVAALVRRSGGTVAAWEILNEPEGAAFLGSPAQYAALLDSAVTAIRGADAAAKVVIGGTPFGPVGLAFITNALRTPGLDLQHRVDVMNLHVRGPVASLPGQVRAWKRFMHDQGFFRQLWITEFGYASDPAAQLDGNFGGPREAALHGGGPRGQARYMATAVPALLRGGAAKVFVTLRDGPAGLWRTEGLLSGVGVADPPGAHPIVTRKPAFGAVRHLVANGKLELAILRGRRLRALRLQERLRHRDAERAARLAARRS